MRGTAAILGTTVLMIGLALTTHAHDTPIAPLVVGSTIEGGGALRLARTANDPVLVSEDTAAGGFVLYTAADPSFENPEADEGVFPLLEGTEVTIEVVAIGATAGVKLRGKTLLAAGDSVVLGTMPALHAHPEWQLTLPEGASACQTITLRARAATTYADSDDYVLQLANAPATCAPSATCGDADGNGAVGVTDGVVVLRTAAGLGTGCGLAAACDVDGSGTVNVTDGVNVLRAAAGLSAALDCPNL